MKHKILLNGRNQNVLSDFLQHTVTMFEAVSTSSIISDIEGHFKFFQPEVYLVFIDSNAEQAIKQLNDVKNSSFYNGCMIVVVGDTDTCNLLERRSRGLASLVIRRPITPDNLALRLTRHLDEADDDRTRRIVLAEKAQQMDAVIRAAEAALGDISIPAAPVVSSGRKHILVVDDDRTVLKMLKAALDSSYDVTAMANGTMVDKVLAAKMVDLIILDYEMPIETGADIFKRLKRNPRLANIPVIFLTGVSDREKIMEVMSLKPHGYILKPIDMDMLTATIRNLIG